MEAHIMQRHHHALAALRPIGLDHRFERLGAVLRTIIRRLTLAARPSLRVGLFCDLNSIGFHGFVPTKLCDYLSALKIAEAFDREYCTDVVLEDLGRAR